MPKDCTAYHRKYWYKRRQRLLDYLGGKCAKCGSRERLEFDHINPELKTVNISHNVTFAAMQVELDKCQLLCNNCHRQKSKEEAKLRRPMRHGTYYAWLNNKCRCEICFPVWRAFHDKRNKKRRKRQPSELV